MKKLMIALTATLGLGVAAAAPAQAGSNFSVSAAFFTPVVKVPVYVPHIVTPFSSFGFQFGNTFNNRKFINRGNRFGTVNRGFGRFGNNRRGFVGNGARRFNRR